MAEQDLQAICCHLVDVAREAGGVIQSARPTLAMPAEKKNTADIVTETDKAVENLIRRRLARAYPTFHFVGEESYALGQQQPITDAPTFVVDPIDGTSNFVHGFPDVAVSIGLVVGRRPCVGVVYNPFQDELWTGVRGHGAFVTLRAAAVAARRAAPPAGGPSPTGRPADGVHRHRVGQRPRGPQLRAEPARLHDARAHGGHGLWECGCWAWDVAAAWAILAEAGGRMVDGHPGGWDPPVDNRRYLAVRPAATEDGQRAFVEAFWRTMGDARSTYGPASPAK
ncbi:Inositol monophosphatase [Niveomyces insectorum RCEF 264]|uniref:Inositol monophosphatase n=1 Tax=Niveomyces insectorum RCEF 264 TaxID=1081102 RepID=A0A167U6V8_9HYPO|nr:Inositol monophosphatase [Niveomyces insectorum RCEF 264]